MVQRYDKKKLKAIIKRKIIIGSVLVFFGIVYFVLIENVNELNYIVNQIIATLLILSGIIVAVLICVEYKKIEEYKTYLALEKYVDESDEFNKHIGILYKIFLDGTLKEKLTLIGAKEFDVFPNRTEESFELEFIDRGRKLVIVFYEERIIYSVLNLDMYIFDCDTIIQEILDFSLKNEKDILEFIKELYYNFINNLIG